MDAAFLGMSGTKLAELIRSGRASSREIVEAHIERIGRVNPVINALVAQRFDGARREADRADEAARSRSGRDLPPFHGVPCTIKECFSLEGILLYPPYVSSAPRHDRPLFPPFNWLYTAIFNAMELPVTQVPVGLDREGLPLGVQVVSIPGNDHVTIAAALELEKAFGGWAEPSGTGR